ncbi:NAD(P)-dependent oxidoreductase [Asticcacaulis sp. 201]|uniref:NAD-dependent epimerase/dehydratase family protein n=1 Tax=Asticcacaulis sp. 201 TaxID=3028787 RepID=UPI0029167F09|nr:NAD(P)-dependent oxidoreductase [Asticcacaulis sp. 201]MDV6331963.1 NAD(P)-dependent oxidoreductase [Asticcacaulis sp. 201]
MTILVTGSAGHLGEAIVRTLRARGEAVRGLDLNPSDFTDITGSITDRACVRESMAGVRAVIHTATLHKPHVATHDRQAFVDTNVTGTLVLLEGAVAAGVQAFVFTSTTSAFGAALTPDEGEPAAWITEEVTPVPKNIYGATKLSAELLCELFARTHRLSTVVLRTSRFFPEADDDAMARTAYLTANMQANELLHRRLDVEDAVQAHLLAVERAATIGFGRYIVSATTPFDVGDLAALRTDARSVVRRLFPDYEALFTRQGWQMVDSIDRVYVNARARAALGWQPKYDFRHVLTCLSHDADFRSPLMRAIGQKGYHAERFDGAPYPVAP